jgi:tetratricopeptide (TPR) repeat protein
MKNLLVILFLLLSTCIHCQLIKEYNECAVEALDKEEIDVAIDYFTKVIAINPLDSFAYLDRGMAYERCSRYCDAIADFTSAIKTDPTNVDHYFLRAMVYDKINNYDLALWDYNKKIEI